MKENILKSKSFVFAVSMVEVCKYLVNEKKEYVLSKQLLKSGTSIGANIREAEHAQSKLDFIHKLSIAQKEANETLYWIELLYATSYLSKNEFDNLFKMVEELLKLITSSIKTAKSNSK